MNSVDPMKAFLQSSQRTPALGMWGSFGWLIVLLMAVITVSQNEAAAAENPWDAWDRIPVLDDGRIQPLDSRARKIAVYLTGRENWKEPTPANAPKSFKARTVPANELLFAVMADKETWLKQPVLKCEFRELRTKLGLPERGTTAAIADVIDLEKGFEDGRVKYPFVWKSPEFVKVKEALDIQQRSRMMASRQSDKMPPMRDQDGFSARLLITADDFINRVEFLLATMEGETIDVVPGLDPRVLTTQVEMQNPVKPWISLNALLNAAEWTRHGDPTLAALYADSVEELRQTLPQVSRRGYPIELISQLAQARDSRTTLLPKIAEIKSVFADAQSAYRSGGKTSATLPAELKTLANRLSDLGDALTAARSKMAPPGESSTGVPIDPQQMALSSYPAATATDLEVYYNRLQPFYQVCILFLLATVVVLLSTMVPAERTVYVAGILLSAGAVAFATYGFVLRVMIAGRPPVTNMYETVIWVAYVSAILGLFFALLPRTWPGIQWAWRMTAIPFSPEEERLDDELKSHSLAGWSRIASFAMLPLRIGGLIWLVWVLTASESTFRISSLFPPTTAQGNIAMNSLLVWGLGLGTVLLIGVYLPRTVGTILLSPVTMIVEMLRFRGNLWDGLLENRFFLAGSMLVATFGMILAAYTGVQAPDVMNPNIGSIAAVLRNNFWLTIHVLTIVSSYAAGAVVWGQGNIAMLYYLFGKYQRTSGISLQTDGLLRRLQTASSGLAPGKIRGTLAAGLQEIGSGDDHLQRVSVSPPEEVKVLARFGYTGMQIAVLLLAAGTILGGLWADVSWGRFWDWDPKEVWALISLLVYIAFLHGRFAGWVGTFGTNLGSVMCFNAILFSWFGVNFVLPMIHGWWNGTNTPTSVGLHSYAVGEGGYEYVAAMVLANTLLVLFAWARYVAETGLARAPVATAVAAPANATPSTT